MTRALCLCALISFYLQTACGSDKEQFRLLSSQGDPSDTSDLNAQFSFENALELEKEISLADFSLENREQEIINLEGVHQQNEGSLLFIRICHEDNAPCQVGDRDLFSLSHEKSFVKTLGVSSRLDEFKRPLAENAGFEADNEFLTIFEEHHLNKNRPLIFPLYFMTYKGRNRSGILWSASFSDTTKNQLSTLIKNSEKILKGAFNENI